MASEDVGDWLLAARGGSARALGDLLEHYRYYLLHVARGTMDAGLQAKGGASDVVQETFLEAQRDFHLFHGRKEQELRAWLRRLLMNNAANFTRRYRGTDKRQVALEVSVTPGESSFSEPGLAGAASTPSERAVRHEQSDALQQGLARLPEDYRAVLLLRYREGHSFEEIAAVMGRTGNAVRKLWARALERLREEMGADPPAGCW
jgi:RNA polymerase sigma-70 factor (ECF subfamily)